MNPCFFPLVRSVSGALLLFSPAEATTAKGKGDRNRSGCVWKSTPAARGSVQAATFHMILTGAASGGGVLASVGVAWLECRPLSTVLQLFPLYGVPTQLRWTRVF